MTSAQQVEFLVSPEAAGQRLDAFLARQLPESSRVHIRRGIDNRSAKVDGTVRKASYRLQAGQRVEFLPPKPASTGPEPEAIPLDILYEDDQLVAINKRAGMVVHPARGHWSGTLASALVHHFQQLSSYGGTERPGIVHRLDRDTSGVLVVAKTDQAHRHLADQFKARTVQKEYLALVAGSPTLDRDLIDFPIGDHPASREKKALRRDHHSSRQAQTFYEVLERFRGSALVTVHPKTGRTHQIRLHMAHIRCPILCDKLYGGRKSLTVGELRTLCQQPHLAEARGVSQVLLARQALHAHKLAIDHPTTGERLEFIASLAEDIDTLLAILRKPNG